MRSRLPARYAYPLVGLLFVSAGVVAVRRLNRPAAEPSHLAAGRPPPPEADTADPSPTAAGAAEVERWAGRLSSTDDAEIEQAVWRLEWRPYVERPLVEAVADRPDLSPAAAVRLATAMPRFRRRAALARRRAHAPDAIAAFYQRQALDGYLAGGHTDAKWDAAAVRFLQLANQRYALHRPDAFRATVTEARRQLRLAVDAGCDDPTVLACGGLLTGETDTSAEADWFDRADRAYTGGSPLFRSITAGRLLRPAADWDDARRRSAWPTLAARLGNMTVNTDRVLATPGVPAIVAVYMATNLFDRADALHVLCGPFITSTLASLERAFPDDPGMLLLKGRAHISWAWEARGGGYANTVTPQGWADFAARLKVAEAALTRAWQLDPGTPEAARHMLTVVRGQGGGPDQLELWLDRALSADPDCIDACWDVLTDLEPKWGGDPEQMIAFGRQCLAEGNWGTGIPAVLADAHWRVAHEYSDNPVAYWLRPGVWDDLRAVYAGYLVLNPDNWVSRNSLARYAVLCHQWRAADEQFRALGDRAKASLFGNGSAAALDEVRRTAARLAGDAAAQGR